MKKLIFISLCVIGLSCLGQNSDFDLEKTFNPQLTSAERAEIKDKIYTYSQRIKDEPNNAVLYLNRGVMYANLGLFPDAITDYNKAIKLDPNLAEAYFNRGLARARFMFTSRSCEDLKKAAELGLEEAKIVFKENCGRFVREIGDVE